MNNAKTEGKAGNFEKSPDQARWEALLRGQIIAANTHKFFNYIRLADQKAQVLILLNTLLVPMAVGWMEKPGFEISATVCIFTCVTSILFSFICIYPKRRSGHKPDGTLNLLHFSDIGLLKEEQFIDLFMPVFNDSSKLAEIAIKDLHDVARRIILPKFYWLKLSYAIFFLGNLAALLWTLYVMWQKTLG